MKKSKIRLQIFVLLTMVLLSGCGDKKTAPPEDGKTSQTTKKNNVIILSNDAQEDVVSAEEESTENAPAQTENRPAASPEKEFEDSDYALLSACRTRHVYGGILSMLAAAYELPDMELETQSLYDGTYSMSDNRFAVADVDGDSREELIISYTTSGMAGMFVIVYDYNPDTLKLTRELLDFTDMVFYDNGIVKVSASHNHSLSMDFWPYILYQYNPQTDQYDYLAGVSAWDKTYGKDMFPEDVDLDGDGIIYEIQTDPNQAEETTKYDESDFTAWISQYMDSAQEIQIDYQPVSAANFQNFVTDHLALLHSFAKTDTSASQTDIGWLYIQKSSLHEAEQYLSDHYAIEWKENAEFEDEHIGSYEGKEVFHLIHMDNGILSYSGNQVEDINIFGIYPGMDENTAVKTLMSYGFYPKENLENYMITGDGFGNAAVSYKISNGTITEISVSAYCSYAG